MEIQILWWAITEWYRRRLCRIHQTKLHMQLCRMSKYVCQPTWILIIVRNASKFSTTFGPLFTSVFIGTNGPVQCSWFITVNVENALRKNRNTEPALDFVGNVKASRCTLVGPRVNIIPDGPVEAPGAEVVVVFVYIILGIVCFMIILLDLTSCPRTIRYARRNLRDFKAKFSGEEPNTISRVGSKYRYLTGYMWYQYFR